MSDRYLIIKAKFNDMITRALATGAQETFANAGIEPSSVDQLDVPGSFELPVVAAKAARSGRYSAIVCLGCVIRGDTPHFDYVAGEAASGLMNVSVETGVPIIFGVLTTDTAEQALDRAGLKGGNKGADAASSALEMVRTMNRLQEWG